MSAYYGSMKGARGETTRTGTKASGIGAHVRNWDVGLDVQIGETQDGRVRATIAITGGSDSPSYKSATYLTTEQLEGLRDGRLVLTTAPTADQEA